MRSVRTPGMGRHALVPIRARVLLLVREALPKGLEVTINPGALLGALLISGVMWYAIFHGFIALAGALK